MFPIPLRRQIWSATLPGNPTIRKKLGDICLFKQFEDEDNINCEEKCCSKGRNERCGISNGNMQCLPQCPSSKPKFNPTTKLCEPKCSLKEPYYNENTGKCEECPQHMPKFNFNLGLCESKCPGGSRAGGNKVFMGSFEMGTSSGRFTFYREHIFVPDQTLVTYEGKTIYDSGCVSNSETVSLSYSGKATNIVVKVRPNCSGSTSTRWNFRVYCPSS